MKKPTLSEIVLNPDFQKLLGEVIDTKTKIKELQKAPTGKRFLRTPLDSLIEKRLFNTHDMIQEFVNTINKTSDLSRKERDFVAEYVGRQVILFEDRMKS